ncbi:peptidoglycan recognition family protein [Texcoconibacillus texcoconensis]|uniref:peptidoglycan recognition protein family protein n=1 Tax=Texcoconibacillus texcoconensis TaxID=1095777 RepID=UPI0031B63C7F
MEDVRDEMPGGESERSVDQIEFVVRHHTASENDDAHSVARHHTEVNGWRTAGYHEIILRDGTIQLMYDPEVISNGVGGHNTSTYHISLVGAGSFTEAQEESWRERAQYNLDHLGLGINDVRGHQEFSGHRGNECPGRDMDAVREELEAYMDDQNDESDDENAEDNGGNEEDDDTLELSDWQWDMLEEHVEALEDEGHLDEGRWSPLVRERDLTVSELSWLAFITMSRQLQDEVE